MATPLRRKLLAALIAPILFLALGEGVLRLAGYRFDPVMPGASDRSFDEWGFLDLYRPDPELLWTMHPSSPRIHNPALGFVEVRSNSFGLRGAEVPADRDPEEVLVVCLGDSIVFGIGLEEDDTLPVQLERALAKHEAMAGRPVRVINGGLPGWSSVQGRRLLERLAPLKPDAVVFWYGMNDAQKARGRPDEIQQTPDTDLLRATSFLRSLRTFQLVQEGILALGGAEDLRRVTPQQFERTVEGLIRDSGEGGPVPIFVRTPERLSLTLSQLEAVVRRAEEEGTEKIFGPIALLTPIGPAEPGVDLVGRKLRATGYPDPVLVFGTGQPEADSTLEAMRANRDIARAVRVALDKLLATLPEDSVTGPEMFGNAEPGRVFIDNCHLSPLGTKLAAEALAKRIVRALAR